MIQHGKGCLLPPLLEGNEVKKAAS
ncbi:hypothetical protein BSG1_07259 [Bacillus sp. SG-1]|nr:hypothetical protein BSG1_07259 [Bacillus sp. SG-1]